MQRSVCVRKGARDSVNQSGDAREGGRISRGLQLLLALNQQSNIDHQRHRTDHQPDDEHQLEHHDAAAGRRQISKFDATDHCGNGPSGAANANGDGLDGDTLPTGCPGICWRRFCTGMFCGGMFCPCPLGPSPG
jgi:hypothetical protein